MSGDLLERIVDEMREMSQSERVDLIEAITSEFCFRCGAALGGRRCECGADDE